MNDNLNKYKNEIIDKFKNGVDINDIAKQYNTTFTKIYHMITTCLKHDISNIDKSTKDEIVKLYANGLSCPKIGLKFNLHHKAVSKILSEYNVKCDDKHKRKYTLNENYFDCIDSNNKAYILGLLFADGYNSIDKSTIRLQLQYTDVDVLKMINKEICSDKDLKFIKCSDHVASNGYVSKDMYILEFYGKHICKSLDDIGMHQNKSLILNFPDIDSKYYSHFLRGYFDGDGSYCHRILQNGETRDLVTFTSTNDFCQKAKDVINKYSKVNGGGIYDCSSKNGITKVLSFSGRIQTKNLLDWLYNDAEIYIKRKHDIYINVFYKNNNNS